MEGLNFKKMSTEQITRKLLLMIGDEQTSSPLFQPLLDEAKSRFEIGTEEK